MFPAIPCVFIHSSNVLSEKLQQIKSGPNFSLVVKTPINSCLMCVCVCLQGFAIDTKSRRQGFHSPLPRQQQKVIGFGFRGHGRGVPSLTCLHTRDAGGVKHPLPLSRTQRDLVCQQVYLTQRPTQRIDKTVEQRQLNVSVQQRQGHAFVLVLDIHIQVSVFQPIACLFMQHVTRGDLPTRVQSASLMHKVIQFIKYLFRKSELPALYGHWAAQSAVCTQLCQRGSDQTALIH